MLSVECQFYDFQVVALILGVPLSHILGYVFPNFHVYFYRK